MAAISPSPVFRIKAARSPLPSQTDFKTLFIDTWPIAALPITTGRVGAFHHLDFRTRILDLRTDGPAKKLTRIIFNP
jgi:hypothetical protein